ncbi:MAG: hypothetical protein ACRCYQ_13435 [Nocardioides sp.]
MPVREVLFSSLLSIAVGIGPAASERDLRFTDRQIIESSGLVVAGRRLITTNDSSDLGRLYVVDRRTGDTVRRIDWSADPIDVEGLAGGPEGTVWVADIGDNGRDRELVSVALVELSDGRIRASHELRYPDGPADAEAVLRHPRTGQLFIATKSVFGGRLFAVPKRPPSGRPAVLRELGAVAGVVTDGAFFPDGRHFVLRGYDRAFVYAYPAVELVGDFELPAQEQGEGLAMADQTVLYLSSEGVRSPILRVPIPDRIRQLLRPAPPPVSPSPKSRATSTPAPEESGPAVPARPEGPGRRLLGGALGVAVLIMLVAFRRRIWR